MELISQQLIPLLEFLGEQYGLFGEIMFWLVVVVTPSITILLDLGEAIASLTETKKDDETIRKIRTVWDKIRPFLELIPHSKMPIIITVKKVISIVKTIVLGLKGAIRGWLNSKKSS